MKKRLFLSLFIGLCFFCLTEAAAQPGDTVFRAFCFTGDRIPQIDGDTRDWSIVPEGYVITIDDMVEDEGKHAAPDKSTLDIRVKVGWSPETGRLYFLYEAWDDYWAFSRDDLSVDIFEVVVDGDRSGGPFIARFYPFRDVPEEDAYRLFQGRHAQNYHIYTPSQNGDWCWYWGPQQWLKEKPWSDYAYVYDFQEGESGKLTLEFYITPFDYASPDGPEHSVASQLWADKLIGLCWAVIDFDNSDGKSKDGFWNLSRHHTMYGNASLLRTFQLMKEENK